MKTENEGFSSTFGAIMAAAGSAVGLGNIWRFPYICGKYGGGAFLVVYIFFVFLIGMTLMMSEFVIGRRTGEGPHRAYSALRPAHPAWRVIGLTGLGTCFLILSVYLIISGWTTNYFWESLVGTLAGIPDDGFAAHFNEFVGNPSRTILFIVIFLVLTTLVIIGGVEKGIERISKLLMPILVVLLLVMCVRSVTLEGASAGLAYLFNPDFSKLTGEGVLAALGQALFSLSVGMGAMVVYGSYLPKDSNILKTSVWIAVCDFAIAILAGIAIFPAVFACGQSPAEGPGLVYQVLPVVFNSFGGVGRIFSIAFFLLLTLAALTSAISLLEALTRWVSNAKRGRTQSAVIMSVLVVILSVLAAFSFGDNAVGHLRFGDMTLFDLLDKLTGTVLPPVCALLTIIFFGWVLKADEIKDELSNHGVHGVSYFKVFYYVLARFVAPVALLVVLISGLLS